MEQTVYADIFFLINFSMDFLALFLVARLLDRKIVLLRFILAAALGGIYACVALFLPFSGLFSFLVDAIACVIMTFFAVGRRRQIKNTLIFSLVFGAVSILLGGAMTALFNLFNKIGLDKLFGDSGEGDGISVWLFLILAIISGMISAAGSRFFKRRSARTQGRIEISYAGATVNLECLLDSGNLLREPISRLPCVVANIDAMKSIFPHSFIEAIKKGDITRIREQERTRVRMIPVNTAVGETIMYGIRVDSIKLDFGKGEIFIDAYLVLSKDKISAKGIKVLVPSESAFGAP